MLTKYLQHTFASSLYAQEVYAREQDALQQDHQHDPFEQALTSARIAQLVHDALAGQTLEYDWMRALRRLRARLMFRWIYQDCNALTDVVQLTRELSDFADAAIIAAKDFAYAALANKYGQPRSEAGVLQDLIIIGMGKLGAQELNLSSDIDLIFAFDENGESDGYKIDGQKSDSRKCIDVQQFCIFWGQKLIYLLEHVSADGFVFRVDMRLRPWGDGSALALSHVALEKYLSQHGREWERYAWIKARAITGGAQAAELMQMTRPFVFRRYVDYSAIAAMRDMKAMIEREVQRRQIANDIKLGAGGIREVEFIVQVFQLIYGGSRRALQARQCLVNLEHLAEDGFLAADVVADLRAAYLFLRRVEHAIQALRDQQTQALPQEPALQQCLLTNLGFSDWDALIEQLDSHRNAVKQQFKLLIRAQVDHAETDTTQQLQDALMAQLDSATQQRVQDFWQSQAVKKLPVTARERLQQFWPHLQRTILDSSAPQHALLRLMPLIESVLRRSVYLVMLTENQGALQRLVKMAQASPWICEQLTRYPVLLDEFLSMDFSLPQRQDLADSLRQQLLRIEADQVEEQLRALRLFKHSQVLAVAASDVLAESPLMKVSDALTDIAEVTVQATLQLAYTAMVARHGHPQLLSGERASAQHTGFVVIGYGKLGGIELGYGSDLDLVFIHYYDEQADTNGSKVITGVEFAIRLAQKLMSLLTTQTLDGRAYEVDTRLRPSGEAGMLVPSLNAFEQYQRKSAWLWEHQALVRARAIAGDAALTERFITLRQQILTHPREEAEVRAEVLKMRDKMKAHLGTSSSQKKHGIFHLKQDAGGIVDIEFMAQYAVLAWSGSNPDLAHFSDNVRILEDAAKLGCLSSEDASALIQAYLRERAESHRLALANQSMQVNAADWHTTREIVYNLWQRFIDPNATPLVDD